MFRGRFTDGIREEREEKRESLRLAVQRRGPNHKHGYGLTASRQGKTKDWDFTLWLVSVVVVVSLETKLNRKLEPDRFNQIEGVSLPIAEKWGLVLGSVVVGAN